MIVFREDKTYEEEIKTWQFWHSRQHSAKQRILEVDSKNSSGMIGQIEEIAHNAVQFYWNPSENGVKVGVGKRGPPQPLTSPLDFTQPPAFCGH
ncbi:CP2 transcription factor [Oesophagostomum dentatum]|uniref:CP2 transcription factor n=1 Tax=Oesophagostomum dentatum TaxID=61180 RepID=A0A0B1RSJ7_OESDE|nr:CP2 transcription factor [Oesophagostomum dentatum]